MENIKFEFEEQANLIADKVTEVLKEELQLAKYEGRLKGISEESFEDLQRIVHSYYSEYRKPYGGGHSNCDINDILVEAIRTYMDCKKDSEKFVTIMNLDHMPLRKLELEMVNKNFAKYVSNIDFKVLDSISYDTKFIDEPKYQFGFLGNAGPFCIAVEDENEIPTQTQYMDKNGKVLDTPIVTYYYMGKWIDTYPLDRSKTDESQKKDDTVKKIMKLVETRKELKKEINEIEEKNKKENTQDFHD